MNLKTYAKKSEEAADNTANALLSNKFVSVAAIENGTVIDHIDAGKAIYLLRLLKLSTYSKQMTVGLNLPSSQLKTKDIIKIEGRELSQSETSQIAIFAPQATISIIQNFSVVNKYPVEMPSVIEHFVICPNLNCVTNHERTPRIFDVLSYRKEVQLHCKFCEKIYDLREITNYALQ